MEEAEESYSGLTPKQEAESEEVYRLVAAAVDAEDGVILKEELVKVQGGGI